jgi:predicted ATPase
MKYGLTNEQMMNYLLDNGIEVRSHMSAVDVSENRELISKLQTRTNLGEHINHTSLKKISIYNLFGKNTYHIDFRNDICIWVSENGRGKTTILNIIMALLKGDKKTLREINFEKIEIVIGEKKHIIDKKRINRNAIDTDTAEHFFNYIRKYIPGSMFTQLLSEYKKNGSIDLDYVENLLYRYGHRNEEMLYGYPNQFLYFLEKIRESEFDDFSNELYEIKRELIEEPLFYPTYRRIEISRDKIFTDLSNRNVGEYAEYIKFGMKDVKNRIDELLDKMSKDAYNSYIEMSGSIINELLDGKAVEMSQDKINQHKIEVVIKRIGEKNIGNIERLNSFVAGKITTPNDKFLKFYLSKLVKIYDSQKAIDEKLTKFANVCSKYLSGKKVEYNETMLTLNVYNEYNGEIAYDEEIRWEDLSSGEKQIVSIFSKVYLDVTTSSIFVIDEPEISLSIEWQKEFLKDVYNSGKVGLLIATTHSPFIFKNEFREYTTELETYRGE